MNKERYILGVKEMKHLKELGLKIESDEDSVVYWVKFIQTQGKRKCHKWKLSIRSAEELNRRNPQFGHYIGMPAYTLESVIERLAEYDRCTISLCCDVPHTLERVYNMLLDELAMKEVTQCQQQYYTH